MKKLKLSGGERFEMGTENTKKVIHPEMGAENLTLNYARHEPGDEFTQHVHEESEDVIIVLDGNGVIKLGAKNETIPIETGDVIYVPPGEQHGTVNTGDEVLEMISCQAPPETDIYK